MAPIKNVALAGSGGAIGPSIINAFLSSDFNLTVLTRSSSNPSLPPGTKTISTDYTLDSLISAFKSASIDAVVSNLGATGGPQQRTLIEASLAAGVQRFIPSSFGSNLGNANLRKIAVYQDKVETEELLQKTEDKLTWTALYNGPFLDWGLEQAFILNVKGGTVELYDGGDGKWSTTTVAGVGRAVVGILEHPEETKNRAVTVHEAVVSQKQLLQIAKRVRKEQVEENHVHVKTEQLEKEAYDSLGRGELSADVFVKLIRRGIFGEGFDADFGKTDNEVLGVKVLSDGELEEVVKKVVG